MKNIGAHFRNDIFAGLLEFEVSNLPPAPDMQSFIAAIASLDSAGIPCILIGGKAVLLHGRPRLTEDIDITFSA